MNTERQAALSLLRKWLGKSTLLYCQANLAPFAAGVVLRIVSVSDEEVRAQSDDGKSQIAVALERAVSFGHADRRSVEDEAKDFDAGLVIFFDDPQETDDPELVAFMERREKV